jgi:hypothetical protein
LAGNRLYWFICGKLGSLIENSAFLVQRGSAASATASKRSLLGGYPADFCSLRNVMRPSNAGVCVLGAFSLSDLCALFCYRHGFSQPAKTNPRSALMSRPLRSSPTSGSLVSFHRGRLYRQSRPQRYHHSPRPTRQTGNRGGTGWHGGSIRAAWQKSWDADWDCFC